MKYIDRIKLSALPNICTFSALATAFIALVFVSRQQYMHAYHALLLAAIFDSLDGRIARLTHSNSIFGAELDSLSDLVAFGLVPAYWSFQILNTLYGWFALIPAFCYLAATATRLARFNTTKQLKHYFMGIPCPPAGIFCASLLVYFNQNSAISHNTASSILLLSLLLMSYLQIATRIKFPNFKHLHLPKSPWYRIGILLLLIFLFICIVMHPYLTIICLGLVYIISSLVISIRS